MKNKNINEPTANKEVAICDFCNRNEGVVQDISDGLSIVICRSCEQRMKSETKKYVAECTICGDECVRCSL